MVNLKYRCKYELAMAALFVMLFHLCSSLSAQDSSGYTAQEISEYAEDRYGPLLELISGEKYYYPYREALGNPFLYGEGSQTATLQILGRTYENQRIRFDIYNQFVLLDFNDETGAARSIILEDQFLDHFEVNGVLFKKCLNEQGSSQFGQVIYEGDITCYYLWEKRYSVDTKVGELRYSFSDPTRISLLVIKDQIHSYKSRRSFLRNFQDKNQVQIKFYLNQKSLSFRKISDQEMGLLMEYINQSYGNEN